jgi:hypothetical protein
VNGHAARDPCLGERPLERLLQRAALVQAGVRRREHPSGFEARMLLGDQPLPLVSQRFDPLNGGACSEPQRARLRFRIHRRFGDGFLLAGSLPLG